jgi:transmembrane sensor
MDEVIIRSLQGTANAAEAEALRAWRQEDLRNERYYRDTARAWRLAAVVGPARPEAPDEAVRTAARARHAGVLAEVRARGGWSGRAPTAVRATLLAAAALVVGVAVGVFWPRPAEAPGLAAGEIVTGAFEMVTTRLSDGSVVRLAPQSRLLVTASGPSREVWLDGRAFFAVAPDNERSFIVRTRAGDAVVLGTRFDVKVDENGMQVIVVEGRVAHQAGGRAVQVLAMEVSHVTGAGEPTVRRIDDPVPLLQWLGEFLVFQATPLRDVARELERQFGVAVRVADTRVGERTVTAWFTHETLEEVLLIVCRAADAHCVHRDGVVTIEP